MTATLLDGRALAARIEGSLRSEVDTFVTMFHRRPRLVVVLVGDLAASGSYVKSKASAADRVGIDSDVVRVPATATTDRPGCRSRTTPNSGRSPPATRALR